MTTYQYDGTYDGLLCALYAAYHGQRERPGATAPRIASALAGERALFETVVEVATDKPVADRVEAGLYRVGGRELVRRCYRAFLADEPAVEDVLYGLFLALAEHGRDALENHLLPSVRELLRRSRKTSREEHRMHAYVRFERDEAGLYRATVEPECHVTPLLGTFFAERYPAQRWAIFDARRSVGLYYPGAGGAAAVELFEVVPQGGALPPRADLPPRAPAEAAASAAQPSGEVAETPAAYSAPDEDNPEAFFQALWRAYFRSVNIPERENRQLQLRHLPRRYHRNMLEMWPSV
jgi:probable DNA metabolism protein